MRSVRAVPWRTRAGRLGAIVFFALLAASAAPAAAQSLSLQAGTSYGAGTNVAVGVNQQPVLRFRLAAGSAGPVSVSAIRATNLGTAQPVCRTCADAPIANPSIHQLLLFQDAAGNGLIDVGDPLIGRAIFDPGTGEYVFANLSFSIAQGATVSFIVATTLASGARPGDTFNFSVAPSDVIASVVTSGSTVTGATTPFTIAAGPLEGDATASSASPTVSIVNPGDGGIVLGPFLVQARLYNPAGIAGNGVAVSFDGGNTYPCVLTQNPSYPAQTNAGIWQAQVSIVTTAASGCQVNPGGVSLKARANASALATSSLVVVAALDRNGTAKASGDGMLLVRDNASQLCADCHSMKSHSSETTSNKYGAWSTSCRDCHQPHATTNISLLSRNFTPPALGAYKPAQRVNITTQTGDSGASYTASTASFANSDGTGPCQACHSRTRNPTTAAARWRNPSLDPGGNADTHYTGGTTMNCTGCHSHAGGFAPGESQGNSDCGSCHGNLATPMESASNYHHYLDNTGVSTLASGSKYPTASPGTTADEDRRCLMCHVDHDLFRPDLNASGARARNLRTDVTILPTASGGFTATDFDATQTNGGLCTSCHTSVQAKSFAQRDGSNTTPVVAKADYGPSAHAYAVPSTFKDGSTFAASCSKCHTDTLGKTAQTSTVKFGLHDSSVRRMTAPMGDAVVAGTATGGGTTTLVDTTQTWTTDQFAGYAVTLYDATNGTRTAVVKSVTAPSTLGFLDPVAAGPVANTTRYTVGDPSEERFCLQCHGGGVAGNDWYGGQGMSQAAKRFDQFGKFSVAGTISTTAASASVTGSATSFQKAAGATGVTATFTNGSSLVAGTGTTFDSSMVGWSIKSGSSPTTWYTIVKVNGATSLTISPSFQESTATSLTTWRIAAGDWYLRASADPSGLWYRVTDVASATSLTVYPPFGASYTGSNYVLRSAPGHPLSVTSGQHRVDESTASGWNGGTARHVTCADCHAPHASRSGNHTPGATSSGNLGGPNVGAWGVSVTYASRTGTATFTNASRTVTASTSVFLSSDVGKNIVGPDGVVYSITAYASGTSITIGTTSGYKGTTATGTFTIRDPVGAPALAAVGSLATTDMQSQLCLKCHSPYGYGASPPTTMVFATNGAATAATQTDVSRDFNPGQLAHHGVMAIGNNQPPDTANPNWGSSAGRKNATYLNAQGVTVANPNAGLDNNFVDGWGKTSRVACSDCHSSNSPEDPWGPHGSANAWILRGIDPNVTVTIAGGTKTYPNKCYYKGTGAVNGSSIVPDSGDAKNLCLNCHRADVYGLVTSGGNGGGTSCDATTQATQVNPIVYANFARVTHPADQRVHSNATSQGALTRWGIYCMQCHGGASLGTIHGTNAGVGTGGTSYLGKRFLAGAFWTGVTRAGAAGTSVTCWTKSGADQVNTCARSHNGSGGNSANYGYDPGGD